MKEPGHKFSPSHLRHSTIYYSVNQPKTVTFDPNSHILLLGDPFLTLLLYVQLSWYFDIRSISVGFYAERKKNGDP